MPEHAIGTDRCECTGCGEWFNSVYAFDKHQVLTDKSDETNEYLRCLTVSEMEAKGMSKNRTGFWITSAYTGPKTVKAKKGQAA